MAQDNTSTTLYTKCTKQKNVYLNIFFNSQLVGHNGTPYTFKQSDHFEVTICHEYSGSDDTDRKVRCIIEPDNLPGYTSIQVSFTVRISGWYIATFKINGDILSDVCHRCYEPGEFI